MTHFSKAVVTAIALFAAANAANAATVSTVIDFDGLNGNLTDEVIGDYSFTTLNIQSSTQCATGQCIQEVGQGNITTMTRVDNGLFDLDSFYFSLQGNGPNASNSVTVTANTGVTFTYALGDVDVPGQGDIFLYDNANDTTGSDLSGSNEIDNSQGANGPNYVVFFDTEFDDVLSITWSGATTANTRIDNIGVSSTTVSVVPLPATGFLMMASLAGLGAVARRRR